MRVGRSRYPPCAEVLNICLWAVTYSSVSLHAVMGRSV